MYAIVDIAGQQLKVEKDELSECTHSLESQLTTVETVVETLQNIENASQIIRSNPEGADAYYQRGLNHQKLGDKTGAIDDYTEALHLDSTYAKAYHSRGVLLAEIGNRKQAVEDLRLAAKYYFEQGDIESYEQARNLSKEFYQVRYSLVSNETPQTTTSQNEMNEEMSSESIDLMMRWRAKSLSLCWDDILSINFLLCVLILLVGSDLVFRITAFFDREIGGRKPLFSKYGDKSDGNLLPTDFFFDFEYTP